MKVLCVCEHGNSRSVALAYLLKRRGHDALAMGLRTASAETQAMLCQWADCVVLTDRTLLDLLPSGVIRDKLKLYDVGADTYFKGYSRELLRQFYKYLDNDPL